MSDKNENIKFEAAMERLENVVKSLENDKVPLDEMLRLYEEGVGLVRNCLKQLDEAEHRVQVLRRGNNGDIETVDFEMPQT